MGIVGLHPQTGIRIEATRVEGGPPWEYRGEAVTPTERLALRAAVSAEGAVAVELPEGAPPGAADRVRLIFRAAWKHAHDEGAAPPRRIVRWRAHH